MIYSIAKVFVKVFLHIYHRVRVDGTDKIPMSGPLIVVGNHVSNLDPFYIGAMFPRAIHYMAKHEVFHNPILRRLLRIAGAFPVNREKPETQTMRTALNYLKNGEVVGIFPEGGRKEDHSFQELKQGAAYLAVKQQCPVVPVFISGTEVALPRGASWIKPARITIQVGSPIEPPPTGSAKEKQARVSQQIQQELVTLKTCN
ncbi:lysophospholipid acyltransferase family protein [Paenactinomyces guangxiensis]|uniref:1-acyl-sn-glycerol-3-phosphate acyltransferase n=1 Tax=Paenactinomyces guangxiensis TaxID=1490290 RepID=A0A7W1WQA5_9BACL|nr:lysophospholipid acyltransferase family protein [Paenactinomyces guangxiensis]MBA4494097.1 1-acyl-sn-glycerol-3-phosphate acyltransferase [Paenactinomyces guangxiensis]MBH8591158.1 1-acyl-sn-glycerol-3-phosphate acyltransferase [Paenactinomyces guangxiensis]